MISLQPYVSTLERPERAPVHVKRIEKVRDESEVLRTSEGMRRGGMNPGADA
jgi:hypothetical protein